MAYRVTVNGKSLSADVEAGTPLLWVLRDTLGLHGSKFGCGIGVCGACSVHLDGRIARACRTPIETVGERKVTTVEGIGSSEIGRKLVEAWIDHDVMQCGYCQAGQIMAAADLLARKPRPSDAEIDQAMVNICRCATYLRIRAAIRQAAGMDPAPAGPPEPVIVR
jgi:isoquinoline 1-oxidoreductase alpha subunit